MKQNTNCFLQTQKGRLEGFNNCKTFIECSNDMDDMKILKNINQISNKRY